MIANPAGRLAGAVFKFSETPSGLAFLKKRRRGCVLDF